MLGLPDDVTFPYLFKLYEDDGYYQYFAKVAKNDNDPTLFHFSIMRGSRPHGFQPDESKPLINFNVTAKRWVTLKDAATYAMKTLAKYPGDVIPDDWKQHVLNNVAR